MKKIYLIISLLVLILGLSGLAYASTDTMGMGNAPGPAATGDNSLDWNPASLGVDNVFILEFDWIATSVSTNSYGYEELLGYAGLTEGSDLEWSTDEVNSMLSKIPSEGFGLDVQATTQPLKMIIGPVGIKAGANGYGVGRIDKDIFRLILKGNNDYVDEDDDNKVDRYLDLTSSKGSFFGAGKTGAAFNMPLHNYKFFKKFDRFYDKLYFGAGLNYNIGLYAKGDLTEDAKVYIGYSDPTEDSSYGYGTIKLAESNEDLVKKIQNLPEGEVYPIFETLIPTGPATGLSFDFGLFARKEKLSYGLSLMDLGSIAHKDYEIVRYGFAKNDNEEIVFTDETQIGTDSYKVSLPWSFNTGAEYRWKRWLKVGAQLSRTHIPKGEDEKGEGHFEFGTGVELNPLKFLPLRCGLIASGATNSFIGTLGTGLHLGPLKFDLSGQFSQKRLAAGLNTSLEF